MNRSHRLRRIAVGAAVVASGVVLATGPAAAWFGEDLWDAGEDAWDEAMAGFEGIEEEGGAAIPCTIAVTGSEQTAPVPVAFTVDRSDGWAGTVTSASWSIDGAAPVQAPGASYQHTFDAAHAGQRTVQVHATLAGGGGCTASAELWVHPKAWMVLTSAPVEGEPLQVRFHAGGMADWTSVTTVNWQFGQGVPVGCPGWCNANDVTVAFPAPGVYSVTASLGVPGAEVARSVTVVVGDPGPQPDRVEPDAPVTDSSVPVVQTEVVDPPPSVAVPAEDAPALGAPPHDPSPAASEAGVAIVTTETAPVVVDPLPVDGAVAAQPAETAWCAAGCRDGG